MNTKINRKQKCRGLTMIEITLVLAVMLSMSIVIYYSLGGMDKWKKGKAASEDLRVVYMAQKTFLADNPTTIVANLTETDLVPYMANGATSIALVEDYPSGNQTIDFSVMPPTVPIDHSNGSDDGLWDVGKP